MARLLLVCLGGALGTGARYGVAILAVRMFGEAFPVGTLIVNVLGCFVMGGVMHAATGSAMSETLRLALTTGFLGGLTTYSAFNFESSRLLGRSPSAAAAYVAVTVLGCLCAGVLGAAIARRVLA